MEREEEHLCFRKNGGGEDTMIALSESGAWLHAQKMEKHRARNEFETSKRNARTKHLWWCAEPRQTRLQDAMHPYDGQTIYQQCPF